MIIKSIKLHNIRSYESAEIEFPLGSVLLAGDIGSGKTTILLSIEFALFGAKKGELSASELLRHGKNEGSVELKMQLDGKEVMIKRVLKKTSDTIKQEAGYVVVNGVKKEGSSEELRAIVLDILGYPKNLLKKSKDLIYRYTVYTPQEQMKQILYEDKETRLDTLRKVFNIDRYKTIKENSRILSQALREKKKNLEGFTLDLEYRKKDIEKKRQRIAEISSEIKEIEPKIAEIKKAITEKKSGIKAIENEIDLLNSLRRELSAADASLLLKIEQNNRLNSEIKKLTLQTEELEAILKNEKVPDSKEIGGKISKTESEIKEAERNYRECVKKVKECEVRIEQCNESIKKINSIDNCPLCEQKVDVEHKHGISMRESSKKDEFISKISEYKDEESKYEKLRIELRSKVDSLLREQNHAAVVLVKLENLNEKKVLLDEKTQVKEKIKKEVGSLNAKKGELMQKITENSKYEEDYKKVKKEIDVLLPQEKFLEIEKGKYEAEKQSIGNFVSDSEKEILKKENAKEELAKVSSLINWINELFSNLMLTIEKHVMVNIHSQFNEFFKNWFDVLLEDESINSRIDEDFTPTIEQNGYETQIENLSGGEKTSVALAYRLALNKVINDIVVGINTKDIIILDEPTDGFSSEQLDKVRDVLNQLNTKQTILVSHESKIEGFVENIIRIQKQDHISVVG
ncbi:MAG TPA: SMC family ATPase [Candidatus Nanoarchaeia archaeon]|nr:SMC family ATPase [Candidatus Nanoarchaeia archaeon]